MLDRLYMPFLALVAAAVIALAMVWPQGQGALSPPPFGHPVTAPPPPSATPGAAPALRPAEAAQ